MRTVIIPGLGIWSCAVLALFSLVACAVRPEPINGGTPMAFAISSNAFSDGQSIPRQFTCDGQDVSPELHWGAPPPGTRSLALIVDDPDAPRGVFTHWVVYDLDPSTREIPEGASSSTLVGAKQGRNDFSRIGYGGPCPPPGPAHRYVFHLYALDTGSRLPDGASKQQVLRATHGHVLAEATMMGTYGRATGRAGA